MTNYKDEDEDDRHDDSGDVRPPKNMKELLQLLTGQKKEVHAEPMSRYPVPDAHVLEFLTLCDEVSKTKCVVSQNRLHRFIYSIMPALVDYHIEQDISMATRPYIRVMGPNTGTLRVGVDNVVEVYVITGDNLTAVERLMELHDQHDTAVSRYHFWAFIEKLHPAVKGEVGWSIATTPHSVTVFRRTESE